MGDKRVSRLDGRMIDNRWRGARLERATRRERAARRERAWLERATREGKGEQDGRETARQERAARR